MEPEAKLECDSLLKLTASPASHPIMPQEARVDQISATTPGVLVCERLHTTDSQGLQPVSQ